MQNWEFHIAKKRFSEIIKAAKKLGPQAISLEGKPMVVVLSKEDYEKLIHPKHSFIDFMRHSPLAKAMLY